MDAVAQAKTVVAAVYLNPQGGVQRNMIALSNEPEGVLQKVVQSAADKTVVVSLGNPYFAAQMPEVQNYSVHVFGCQSFRVERGRGNVW